MTLAKKIRGAMLFKDVTLQQLSAKLGITPEALSNKLYRNSFSVLDLITIANYLGFELCLFDGEQKISIDKADVEKKPKQ